MNPLTYMPQFPCMCNENVFILSQGCLCVKVTVILKAVLYLLTPLKRSEKRESGSSLRTAFKTRLL